MLANRQVLKALALALVLTAQQVNSQAGIEAEPEALPAWVDSAVRRTEASRGKIAREHWVRDGIVYILFRDGTVGTIVKDGLGTLAIGDVPPGLATEITNAPKLDWGSDRLVERADQGFAIIHDGEVYEGTPSTVVGSGGFASVLVGRQNPQGWGYLAFFRAGGVAVGGSVTHAEFRAFQNQCLNYAGQQGQFNLRPVSGFWTEGTLTWVNQPSTHGGLPSSIPFNQCSSGSTIGANLWRHFPITDWAVSWSTGSWNHDGVRLDLGNTPASAAGATFSFATSEGLASTRPEIYVEYQQSCSYSLSPPSAGFGASGGNGSFDVSTAGGCSWSASENLSWVSITSTPSGNGPGTVSFSVEANSSPSNRAGAITVQNRTFSISQDAASCGYSITPTGQHFGSGGGTGGFSVGTSDPACSWSASEDLPWVVIISSANGTGPGGVSFDVGPNLSISPRSGNINVAGHVFGVTQDAESCSYSLTPGGLPFGPSGGSGSFTVSPSHQGCGWSATETLSWVAVTSGASGTGSGTVVFSVDPNSSVVGRTGHITVQGQPFLVDQEGTSGCTVSTIGVGQSVNGSWSSTCSSTHRQGRFARFYSFSLGGSMQVQIDLTATVDSYLYLLSGNSTAGSVLAEDDDSGGGVNARITTTLAAGTYTLEATTFGTGQTGTFTLAVQPVVSCTYTLSSTFQVFGSAGGSGSFDVNATPGCQWSASEGLSWVTITSSASGSGFGTVSFSVGANTSTTSRSGTISLQGQPGTNVQGQSFTITQSGVACSLTLSPSNQSFGSGGGSGSFTVNTASGCQWVASESLSWVTITSLANGNGTGTVSFSVGANNSTSGRSGTISVQGQSFTITQSGASCSFTLSPSSQSFGSAGGSSSFSVHTAPGCQWTASEALSWVTITSGSSAAGTNPVFFTVAGNPTTASRSGVIAVQGQSFTITQSGTSCSYTLSPTRQSFGSEGGLGSFSVNTGPTCQWSANEELSWVSFGTSPSGTGSGSISFGVGPNSTGSDRSGVITVQGQSFQIFQVGAAPPPCGNTSRVLCLNERFALSLSFATTQAGGQSGFGRPLSLQTLGLSNGGLFWFFGQNNPEMLVKVLNGCAVNGNFWLFYSAVTNVGFSLTVTDLRSGQAQFYGNPDRTPATPVQDTSAFPCLPSDRELVDDLESPSAMPESLGVDSQLADFVVANRDGSAIAHLNEDVTNCTPSSTSLCIRKFRVRATFQTSQAGGQSGNGRAVSIGPLGVSDGGMLWFFSGDNPEILVKILNGCAVNGHHWVFASATTNVGFILRITDVETGATVEYVNSDRQAAMPIQDTRAFSCLGG